MSTALECFRAKFESLIRSDTGSGGLTATTGTTTAIVKGVYHAVRPSTPAYPHIFYTITTDPDFVAQTDGTQLETADIILRVEVDVRQQNYFFQYGDTFTIPDSMHNFGFGNSTQAETVAAVAGRLSAVLGTAANWNAATTVNSVSWFFSEPSPAAFREGLLSGPQIVRQPMTWTLSGAKTSTSKIITGREMSMTVKRFDDISGVGATTLSTVSVVGISEEQELQEIDDTRKNDRFDRICLGKKSGALTIRFTPNPATTSTPIIPVFSTLPTASSTGQLYQFVISMGSGASVKTRTIYGRITRLSYQEDEGRVIGTIRVIRSADTSTDDAGSTLFGPIYS